MLAKKLIILTLLLCLFISCADENTDPSPDNTSVNTQNQNAANESDIQALLGLLNAARTQGSTCNGTPMPAVPAFSNNAQLNAAALSHCIDMRDNVQGLSHTGSNGSNAGQRIEAQGYSWSAWGENIALGQTSEQEVFNSWMSSTQGHCENIMNGNFTEIGIARVGNYWTLVLARPQ